MTRLRRFFVPSLESPRIALPEDAAHHAFDVLRLRPGTRVQLFSADGRNALAELQADRSALLVGPLEKSEPLPPVKVAVPLLKGDRQDWLIEKLTELGVQAYVPLLTERSVIRELHEGKRQRYERLIAAACKQCGRDVPLVIEPLRELHRLDARTVLLLDPHAPAHVLDVLELPVTLVLGPEGGLTDAERAALLARGSRAARLAPFVLRAETAALAAAAVVVASV